MGIKSIALCASALMLSTSINAATITDTVIVGDKKWAQLTETTGINFDAIEAICIDPTGLCSGSVSGVELTGWKLASIYEVDELFLAFTPAPGGIYEYTEADSSWAPDFLSVFNPTLVQEDRLMAWGRTRTPSPDISHHTYSGFVEDNFDALDPDRVVTAHTVHGGGVDHIGAFLYQDVAVVPVPAAVWLFGSGLLGLIGFARRKA